MDRSTKRQRQTFRIEHVPRSVQENEVSSYLDPQSKLNWTLTNKENYKQNVQKLQEKD